MEKQTMTQLNDEHFELHDQNKAERYERQKIKFLEDRIKVLETAIESHAKILARFQMTEDNDDQGNIGIITEERIKENNHE
jgi:hypothetical protein